MTETGPTFDELVGRNIQELRTARAMSQSTLAKELEDRGLPFRQQTIVKVEKGQRPLRLAEAEQIAHVLEVDIDTLVLTDSPRLNHLTLVMTHTNSVQRAWGELHEKAIAMYEAQGYLANALKWYRDQPEEVEGAPVGLLGEAETALAADPIQIVRAVPGELEARKVVTAAQLEGAVQWRDFGTSDDVSDEAPNLGAVASEGEIEEPGENF